MTNTHNFSPERVAGPVWPSPFGDLGGGQPWLVSTPAPRTMTRSEFQISAKRMRITPTLISLGVIMPIVCALIYSTDPLPDPLNRLDETLRRHLPEVLASGVFGLIGAVYVVPLFALFVLLLYLADRRLGAQCPHCRRSLTLRCLHERVLRSGECSLCHERVFDE